MNVDQLGHELTVGDWIDFSVKGSSVFGKIVEITNETHPKYIVITAGWRGNELTRESIKTKYNVPVKRKVWKLKVSETVQEKFNNYMTTLSA